MSVETDAAGPSADHAADDLARQLGDAIADLPEYRRLMETKRAVETTDEVQSRIEEFEQLRQEFMLARQSGDADEAALNRVQEAQQHLHDHPVMADYLDAQDALEARFEGLNDLISDPLDVDFVGESGACCQD
ncbi:MULTISPECIES: YlbF family regulator [Halobacterium]|uniref:DUF964 family protein n=4 Tax=Halobacterium salinarum TaxID=2242 RepID=Q9HR57_HALSA|nr:MULTISPECIES: YlbF family regulator [Halobacterium]AAG19301.1 conserved hypothetical protein [Halobacterium salinarum NRC-1]MBB6090415.1 cell fate (sporulation/competence/biofilm development) regulator YlbF (YheA/YmcA/DUF963 family) [Halobacterium salinarum]MCF2166355.1 YlbF family regulator [Halobacterium salinarum]MCF2168138.1 YlbF family regulator [Halobacterium salinarum]MCF2206907.1 YlbF family regulator [Halobacterium salinarum]